MRRKGFAATANLFARRETFAVVGPFQQGVPEDRDWCRRARVMGYVLIYAPRAVVRHPARTTWLALASKWERSIAESWEISGAAGSRRKRVAWGLRAVAVAASPVPHALKVLLGERSVGLRARWHCLGVLLRIRWFRAVRMLELAARGPLEKLGLRSRSATSEDRAIVP